MKLPRPREAHVQATILQYLRLRGAHAIRVNSGAVRTDKRFVRFNDSPGCSDIVCCYRGRFIALEIKRDDKAKPTDLQTSFLGEIRRAGGLASVVWDVSQVQLLLDAIDHEEDED
jgi:hypothetical protein